MVALQASRLLRFVSAEVLAEMCDGRAFKFEDIGESVY